ncbi:M48 family metalloprotease [Actinacidiphila oryziradicis]|uniref:Peptidase M48 domain-containing protein n=1 Tax=Actinacidiphila oryziradicis TaxID=2571141 RepID=A0A4U0RHA2_9ACTN|nr:M48 family metalloprotease [Actinacidiphila oryziradicis]TJZ94959.1 hypothetical protein FCI23_52715 [Actinacidiphila oryziradicis]
MGDRQVDVRRFPPNTTYLLLLSATAVLSNVLWVDVLSENRAIQLTPCGRLVPDLLIRQTWRTPAQQACASTVMHHLAVDSLHKFLSALILGALAYFMHVPLKSRLRAPLRQEYAAQKRRIAELADRVLGWHPYVYATRSGLGKTQVGGSRGTRFIAVSNDDLALSQMAGTSGKAFDAVIVHELAHLRAEDIRSFQGMRATRTLFLAFLLLQLGVDLEIHRSTTQTLFAFAQLSLMAVVIQLLYRAFLRSRELQADVWAADLFPAGMAHALEAAAKKTNRPARLLRRAFADHPDPVARAAAIRDPFTLLRFPPWYALAAGFLAGVTISVLTVDLYFILEATPQSGSAAALAAAIVAVPVTAVLATGMWRHAWANLLRGLPPRTTQLALVLAGGLTAGDYQAYLLTTHITPSLPTTLIIAVASLAAAVALVRWPVAVAFGWFPRQADAEDADGGSGHSSRFGSMNRGMVRLAAYLVTLLLLYGWSVFCGRVHGGIYENAGRPSLFDTGLTSPLWHGVALQVLGLMGHGGSVAIILTAAWVVPLIPSTRSLYGSGQPNGLLRNGAVWWSLAALGCWTFGLSLFPGFNRWVGLGDTITSREALIVIAMCGAAVTTTLRVPNALSGPFAMAAGFFTGLTSFLLLEIFGNGGQRSIGTTAMDLLAGGQLLVGVATVLTAVIKRAFVTDAAVIPIAPVTPSVPAPTRSPDAPDADATAEPLADVTLSDIVGAALEQVALAGEGSGGCVDTQLVLVQLVLADTVTDWQHVAVRSVPMARLTLPRHPDPDPAPAGRWRGLRLTGTLTEALVVAARISHAYDEGVLTSGALLLGLIANSRSAAARAFGVGVEITGPDLIQIIQDDVCGSTLDGVESLLGCELA